MKQTKIYELSDIKRTNFYIRAPWDNRIDHWVRSYGGRWSSAHQQWTMSGKYTNEAECFLKEHFGSDKSHTVKLKLKNHAIENALHIFNRDIVQIDMKDYSYALHSSVEVIKGNFPFNWSKQDSRYFRNRTLDSFFETKIERIFNPFKVRNMTILVDTVSTRELESLKGLNLKWIKEISIVEN